MATETRKFTPQEIKDRRLKAAEDSVALAQRKLDKAEAKVQDAKALVEKRDQARTDLKKAVKHRDWVKSMPVDGDEDETPADGPEAEETQETGVLGDIQGQDENEAPEA